MRAVPSVLVIVLILFASPAFGEITRFQDKDPGTRNFGIWRLTHDPAIRDEANYHNIQCWSPNGRYTCYTHWVATRGPGGKASAEVHVVDLLTGEDRLVDKGIYPRWAKQHNWLFYCHWTGDGTEPYQTGTQVIRYHADTGEKVVITHGVENLGGVDASDTWLFGIQRFRGRQPQYTPVRVRIAPNSPFEILQDVPASGQVLNPVHPVVKVRHRQGDPVYGSKSLLYDLDGSNLRIGAILAEEGHHAWRGDGEYLLSGNKQICGRPWNKPYPSDLEMLAYGGLGDICPMDKAGRYICGSNLVLADCRSGDTWHVVSPYSYIIYPMEGDYSGPYDIDPKGSPDGTKIHYHSTRDIENPVMARVTKYDRKQPDIIHVESTEGFPESGDMICRWEVVGYKKKTPTTFEGLTRQKYGTRPAPDIVRKVGVIFPLSAYVLSEEDKARAKPDGPMLDAGLPKSHPLVYQRQTDCYIVVMRPPFPPHLRLRGNQVELIPGEHHWETHGYRILRDGEPVGKELLLPGQVFKLAEPGTYTAVAVEWSNLESPPSLPLPIKAPAAGKVLKEKPDDFSRTHKVWKVGGKTVSRAEAMKAPRATMDLVHLHDGIIAREGWQKGEKVSRIDLNEQGKPIRFQEFANGKLKKRIYKNPEGHLASEEFYGPDGFKTEYIRYDVRPGRLGRIIRHWWYDHGRPVKKTATYGPEFDLTRRQGKK